MPEMLLNGIWEAGDDRLYDRKVSVPGIVNDPKAFQKGKLWLRKRIMLPSQPFLRTFLHLGGARFCPEIYVNGVFCARCQGGMAPVQMELTGCAPGKEITLEIALASLPDVPRWDASRIPEADWWRTNVSSGLFGDVRLRFTKEGAILNLVPCPDAEGLTLAAEVDLPENSAGQMQAFLYADGDHQEMPAAQSDIVPCNKGRVCLRLGEFTPALWDENTGNRYTACVKLICGETSDIQYATVGWRRVETQDKELLLNGHPLRLRGTSVVWHRFCRDQEGQGLAFDREWFCKAVLDRMQQAGANFLRMHLGTPPEWILDELDKRGMICQIEWSFFHGMEASEKSLVQQWRSLFILASHHPCVCIAQLWNETEGENLQRAIHAVEQLKKELPLPLIDHIDLLPLHKYWWSLFENLNLSYDSRGDLPLPAIADEFGGNYLDGEGNFGGYPDVPGAFERFLGKEANQAERLEFQALSNARIAQYWRKLGIAGFATFCTLSSAEDGSHHYLGRLKDNIPKPVWEYCAGVWAAKTALADIWDRAFVRGQILTLPVDFYNDTKDWANIKASANILDETGQIFDSVSTEKELPPWGRGRSDVRLSLPQTGEKATICIVTEWGKMLWPIRLCSEKKPDILQRKRVRPLTQDDELLAFLKDLGLRIVPKGEEFDVLIACPHGADLLLDSFEEAQIRKGAGMLVLQAGPDWLGEGYLSDKNQVRQDGQTAFDHCLVSAKWPFSMTMQYELLPEAESCVHPAPGGEKLWEGLPHQALQLSNGYRGGLNVSACRMNAADGSKETCRQQWLALGMDADTLSSPHAVAYELCGFYSFSSEPNDETAERLRKKVDRMLQDAPSLAEKIGVEQALRMIRVGENLSKKSDSHAFVRPLMLCGAGLNHAAVLEIRPEQCKGRIIASNLICKHRLHPGYSQEGQYGGRYDPEMRRITANMLCLLLEENP